MTIAEARAQASRIARDICSGDIDAYDGAMTIWKDTIEKLDARIPDDLWPFKANASAIEDCLWNAEETGSNHDATIAQCREEIVQAARTLIEGTT